MVKRTRVIIKMNCLLGFFLSVALFFVIFLHLKLIGFDKYDAVGGIVDPNDLWKLRPSGFKWKKKGLGGDDPTVLSSSHIKDDRAGNDTWLESYFQFHANSRKKFPGESLFTNPAAPGVLLRFCGPGAKIKNYFCGGLNDRLSTLPLDLYLASKAGRILLIKWTIPHPLEEFLIPSGAVDWTVPMGAYLDEDTISRLPTFDVGFDFFRPGKFRGLFDRAVRELVKSKARVYKIMTPSTAFGTKYLQDELAAHKNEAGHIPSQPPLFGFIFHRLFRPSHNLQGAIDSVHAQTGLYPGHYSAVHIRLRHPQGLTKQLVGRDGNTSADRSGLPFSGKSKSFAIKVATHAIECALGNPPPTPELNASSLEPLYLFSDSNDTVSLFANPETSPLYDCENVKVVSRDISSEALHLAYDKGSKYPPSAFFGMFVDLYVAIGARCVTFGVGGFGALAAKISGTACTAQHREAIWSPLPGKTEQDKNVCKRL